MTTAIATAKEPELRLPPHLEAQIREWAAETGDDPQRVLEHIVERYFRRHDRDTAIEEGLLQADVGLTHDHETVKRYFAARRAKKK